MNRPAPDGFITSPPQTVSMPISASAIVVSSPESAMFAYLSASSINGRLPLGGAEACAREPRRPAPKNSRYPRASALASSPLASAAAARSRMLPTETLTARKPA